MPYVHLIVNLLPKVITQIMCFYVLLLFLELPVGHIHFSMCIIDIKDNRMVLTPYDPLGETGCLLTSVFGEKNYFFYVMTK